MSSPGVLLLPVAYVAVGIAMFFVPYDVSDDEFRCRLCFVVTRAAGLVVLYIGCAALLVML